MTNLDERPCATQTVDLACGHRAQAVYGDGSAYCPGCGRSQATMSLLD